MSKIIILFIYLLLSSTVFLPKIASAADCLPMQVTVNPKDPELGKPFTVAFISDKISSGKDYHIKIRTEPILAGGSLADILAKGDSGFVIFNIDKTLPPKDYRAVFYEGNLGSDKEICQSVPFTIKPTGGSSSGSSTQPTDSCTLNATIDNNKLVLSGTGTIKSGEYMPYIGIQGAQSPLIPNLSVNSEGAFGSYNYDLPKNLQGGVSTIGVQHQYYTDVSCTTSTNLPNTTTNTKTCPKQGEKFDPNKHLDPKLCSSAGGEPCTTDSKNPGFKTAIGCIHSTPKGFVEDVLKFATGIGGGLAFMMMLFGAFQMMKSAGNPQSLQEGKDVFTNAVIGILFIIFSILLMKIIGIDILDIPGFS